MHSMRRRGTTLSYSNFEFELRAHLMFIRLVETKHHAYTQALDVDIL
jgi:hypothetical protein